MRQRIELHNILVNLLGNANAYYQPPENIKMNFPCIVYEKNSNMILHADNKKYIKMDRYTLTLIDRSPESPIVDKLMELEFCDFDRHFNSDGLNHYIFTLYF